MTIHGLSLSSAIDLFDQGVGNAGIGNVPDALPEGSGGTSVIILQAEKWYTPFCVQTPRSSQGLGFKASRPRLAQKIIWLHEPPKQIKATYYRRYKNWMQKFILLPVTTMMLRAGQYNRPAILESVE